MSRGAISLWGMMSVKNIVGSGEIVSIVSNEIGESEALVKVVMRSIFRSIGDVLALDDCVRIPNFGTFIPYERQPMTGRNMRTGEPVHVEARRLVRFKASKHLIDKLGKSDAEINESS